MKRFVQLTVSLLICTLWLSKASADDWVYYARYADLFFYDRENINNPDENNSDIIGVWQKTVYSDKSVARISEHLGQEYADLKESIALVEINCFSKDTQTKAVTYYNSKGDVIHTKHHVRDNWEQILPATNLQKLYRIACSVKAE